MFSLSLSYTVLICMWSALFTHSTSLETLCIYKDRPRPHFIDKKLFISYYFWHSEYAFSYRLDICREILLCSQRVMQWKRISDYSAMTLHNIIMSGILLGWVTSLCTKPSGCLHLNKWLLAKCAKILHTWAYVWKASPMVHLVAWPVAQKRPIKKI